ncbi:uncharacterized protein LOC125957217 [Anopheles darlingi]|uniref:uncharacterized protein LOC125957217 n=1 Tax=Anopheles darlingi TaxID=43151 RepID=UPI0021000833|nr:uncharacterized protein LOC125957217 [Anopheles darlingi]
MSFLRTFRSNLILSTAPPADTGKSAGGGGAVNGRKSSSQGRKSQIDSDDRVGGTTTTARRSSNGMTNRNGNGGSTTANRNTTNDSRYGKENPAPIVVYLDKPGQEVKKPASILRTNTFTTKHNDHVPGPEGSEGIRYGSTTISRSDTFTIDDPVPTVYSSTFTHREPLDVFEPLYAKNIELGSNEKLPTVVDTRTYRKKSRNSTTSKPVQKVESFIKRFERTLFNKHGSNDRNRKQSTGGSTTARKNSSSAGSTDSGPRFRDVGINCKLDEEERFRAKVEAMRRSRQGSRDSIISGHSTTSGMVQLRRPNAAPERSQSPTKRYSITQDRRSSSASSFALAPLEERARHLRTPSPPQQYGGNSTVVVPLSIDRPTESSFLKSRQKEIEMGYSVVTKRQQPPPPLTLPVTSRSSPERYAVTTQRPTGRLQPTSYAQEEPRGRDQLYSTFVIARNAGTSEDPTTPRFRTDTYRALKDEYEQQQQQQAQMTRPIGIASPLPNEERPSSGAGIADVPAKDSAASDLPKYTFGTDMQQRRNRFQQFQRSFKKMDDSASDVSVQQSFFVAI